VATAVFDGADAVMLSGETAVGQFPYEAVNMMDRIVARVEQDPGWRATIEASCPGPEHFVADAIAMAARQIAHTVGASLICTFTESGSTALRAARQRPAAPVLSLTPSEATARRLALVWGVHPLVSPDTHSMTETVSRATRIAQNEGFAPSGSDVVVIAGIPFGQPGTTNALQVARVK
jgi:pyruvate kinase